MTAPVVGLFLSPLDAPRPTGNGLAARLLATYRWAVRFKANPRDPAYMEALLREHWPDARIEIVDDASWRSHVTEAGTIVLLYPDAIGLGFGAFERALLRALPSDRPLQVLNGRRRRFSLTPATLRSLRTRRALERSMVGELLATPFIVGAGAVLAVYDRLQGRT